MLPLISKLVNIPSCSDNFVAVAQGFEICKEFLSKNPEIRMEEFEKNGYRSVIFSNSGGRQFDVISLCHLDVVPAKTYEMKRRGNKIFGRGVFDMKGFVASNLVNLMELAKEAKNIRYAVVLTSDEEIGGENGVGYLTREVGLKTALVLDSDSGGDLSKIVWENLGAITIELSGEERSLEQTILNIKNRFIGYHCESYGHEVDINFGDVEVHRVIENCLEKDVTFWVLMLNDYKKHDISDRYHQLYRQIAEKNGIKIEYSTTGKTSDSRHFFSQNVSLISHQASGGDSHSEDEWLALDSLFSFSETQREFLGVLALV
ncbi:MAG: M20/M25/M40 family metallo-hydrolase [Rickettsiales bacterium]|jgi:acetylornithine deacetylase/succinyl-diaminopimelate desuccinylase-like protein|nr:M20/M25/M40 family metallo-hydrolase [Rickettsiales bacterium]